MIKVDFFTKLHQSIIVVALFFETVRFRAQEMKRIFQSTNVEEMLSKADAWGRTPLIACIQASQKLGPGSEKLVMQFIKLMKALPNFSEKIAGGERGLLWVVVIFIHLNLLEYR